MLPVNLTRIDSIVSNYSILLQFDLLRMIVFRTKSYIRMLPPPVDDIVRSFMNTAYTYKGQQIV